MLAGGCGWPPACIRGKPRMQAVKRLKESRAGRIVLEKRKGDRINAEIASATKVPVPRAQKIARRYRGVRPADIVHSRPMGRPASTLPGQEGALNRPVRQGPAQARGAQDRGARGNTCHAQRRTQGVAGRGTGPEESEKAEARVGHARAQALKLDVACGLCAAYGWKTVPRLHGRCFALHHGIWDIFQRRRGARGGCQARQAVGRTGGSRGAVLRRVRARSAARPRRAPSAE